MQRPWPLVLLACLVPGEAGLDVGARHRGAVHRSHRAVEFANSAEWARIRSQEQEDASYWDAEWVAARNALMRLQQCAGASVSSTWKSKLPELESVGGARVAALVKRIGLADQPDRAAAMDMDSIAGPAALTLLNGLYQESKKRITELNLKEDKSKTSYAVKENEHKARIARIEADFKGRKSSVEDQLIDQENYFMNYWGRVRERNKRQFHTYLKIEHAIMEKDKALSAQYMKAMSGQEAKAPNLSQLQKALDSNDPSRTENGLAVSLIQGVQKDVSHFVGMALDEIEHTHDEIEDWDF